ncbi:MAG: glycosyltransferase family 2 protein [bacterium]|nr:glycosyltransferase family 2 protein [bacterium]
MSTVPEISVVMPVRHEETHIEAVVRQLLAQTLAPEHYEILVVDGMSTDGTRDIVQKLQEESDNIFLLDNPRKLASSARNIGARKARGKFVLFVDGHCQISHPEMLAMVYKTIQAGERCVSRPQPLVPLDKGGFAEAVSLARSSIIGHYTGSQIFKLEDHYCNPLTAGCGYEKEMFWNLGGMDETFDAAEDLEFNYRVHQSGVRALHSEKFSIQYYPRTSFLSLFRQLYRYGYGRARMTRKFPSTFSPLPTLMGMLGVWFLVLGILAPFVPVAVWGLIPTFSTYVFATGLASLWAARGRTFMVFLKTWMAFPAIHFGAGLGYLFGLMGGPDWSD